MKFFLLFACVFLVSGVFAGFNLDEYDDFVNKLADNPEYVKDFEDNVAYLEEIEPDYFNYTARKPFDCIVDQSPSVPTSVHRLRPSDIKVVGALGDSLTAALGAKAFTIFGLLLENRGQSWSVGGDKKYEDHVTLPNILKKFNPALKGASTGTTIALFTKDGKGLNAAVSGQEANHLVAQANTLVKRFREDKSINFNNDWKLVTLFIGGNDLCDFCKDKELHSPERYANDIKEALDILYKELPRTFVNVVAVLKVEQVKDLNKGLICKVLHKFECPCAAYPENKEQEEELKKYFEGYQNLVEDLVNTGRYDKKDDFTVVVQPFLRDLELPRLKDGKVDFSYFAPDCFHFSSKGHARSAIALWNNMLEPVGKKATHWGIEEIVTCPTKEQPYFFTSKNSN